jgi:hypothetical protein
MEFEVLRGVIMKNTVFWDLMPCGVVEKVSEEPSTTTVRVVYGVLQRVINTGIYWKDDLW